MNLLDKIRLGIQAKEFFPYDGEMIPVRPIASYEMDQSEEKGLNLVDARLARFIVDIKLGRMKLTDQLNDIPPELYKNIRKFYLEIDYWIVYYGMKDFQPETFSIEDVQKMKYIHEMTKFIIDMSAGSKEVLMEYVRTPEGKELATIIYEWKVPLTDAAWKLTPLQKDFYYWSGDKAPKKVANSLEEFDAIIGAQMKNVI